MDILRWTGNGSFDADVVGESYYQPSLKKIAGDEKRKRVVARLVCETDNPHDKNAVRVEIGGMTVGHLPRGLAQVHRRKLAEMKRGGAVVECEAVAVTGKIGMDRLFASTGKLVLFSPGSATIPLERARRPQISTQIKISTKYPSRCGY